MYFTQMKKKAEYAHKRSYKLILYLNAPNLQYCENQKRYCLIGIVFGLPQFGSMIQLQFFFHLPLSVLLRLLLITKTTTATAGAKENIQKYSLAKKKSPLQKKKLLKFSLGTTAMDSLNPDGLNVCIAQSKELVLSGEMIKPRLFDMSQTLKKDLEVVRLNGCISTSIEPVLSGKTIKQRLTGIFQDFEEVLEAINCMYYLPAKTKYEAFFFLR
ncbi:hypothetical protein RFI_12564 [Reticulomyxa filosa]|uniref:Uncharacterized protein n=1 Tax=Reticulomyxa filosa TaxID=46433 RepID=X6NE43_RETFI|nr:hypothetical protein RFI_12564 [Reticulomyxa filosa]|eukprot:ETO24595.1 hypothetical protein RFI_12564 [Reticulomyxa filosa]